MTTTALIVQYLDDLLETSSVPDYPNALNGLQLANDGPVTRIAAAVDFSLRTVTAAAEAGANLLMVHHGMFWGGLQPIRGTSFARLQTLIRKNIAVYSSHLPLDRHALYGNNALLAAELGLEARPVLDLRREGVVEVAQGALLLGEPLVGPVQVELHPVAQPHQPALLVVAAPVGAGELPHPVADLGEAGQHHLGPAEDGLLGVEQAEGVRRLGQEIVGRRPVRAHAGTLAIISNRACAKSAAKSSPASWITSSSAPNIQRIVTGRPSAAASSRGMNRFISALALDELK